MVETTVGIDGMMCEMCEAHINDAIRKNFAVKSVKSNRKKKQCVIVSEQPLNEDEVRKTIEATGYDFLSFSEAPHQKKKLFGLF